MALPVAMSAWMAAAILLAAGSASAESFRSWAMTMPIVFTGYGKSETLTNFPVLVTLHTNLTGFRYTDFRSPATGADLRFAAANEADELNYEIERWDTNGSSYVWVQVPLLAGTNTRIHAFWGEWGVPAPAYTTNGATWTNGFAGVWHLSETASTDFDSTSNRNDGTPAGGVVQNTNGPIDGADRFDGSDEYVGCGNNPCLKRYNQDFSIGAWIYILAYQNSYVEAILSNRGPANGGSLFMVRGEQGGADKRKIGFDTSQAGGTRMLFGISELQLNRWYHVAMTFQYTGGNANKANVYVNGILEGSATTMSDIVDPGTDETRIGWEPTPTASYVFNGILDEVCVSQVVRSSNWVWACWTNQVTNSAFAAYGEAVLNDCEGCVLELY